MKEMKLRPGMVFTYDTGENTWTRKIIKISNEEIEYLSDIVKDCNGVNTFQRYIDDISIFDLNGIGKLNAIETLRFKIELAKKKE